MGSCAHAFQQLHKEVFLKDTSSVKKKKENPTK